MEHHLIKHIAIHGRMTLCKHDTLQNKVPFAAFGMPATGNLLILPIRLSGQAYYATE